MLKKILFLFIMSCNSFVFPRNIRNRNICKREMIDYSTSLIQIENDANMSTSTSNIGQLTLHFYGSVTEESCLELTQALYSLDKQAKYQQIDFPTHKPIIELHIQSGGGALMPAFYVCDVIKNINTPVHTYVDGYVASAASLISVCGDKRYITKYSSMLIHQLKGATSGKFNEIKDEFSNLGVFMEKVCDIYTINSNINRTTLEDLLSSDIWLDSETCLKYGLVDKII